MYAPISLSNTFCILLNMATLLLRPWAPAVAPPVTYLSDVLSPLLRHIYKLDLQVRPRRHSGNPPVLSL